MGVLSDRQATLGVISFSIRKIIGNDVLLKTLNAVLALQLYESRFRLFTRRIWRWLLIHK